MGISASSLMSGTIELTAAMRLRSPVRTLPEGSIVFPVASALVTSSGDMLKERSLSGSAWMMMVRALPPKGGGAETPGSVENTGRTLKSARS